MRKIIFFLLLSLIMTSVKSQNIQRENFNEFVRKFAFDSTFQIERVMFPLEYEAVDDDKLELITNYIPKDKYKITSLNFKQCSLVSEIYDNFDCDLDKTDKIALKIYQFDTDFCVIYYFALIKNNWFLVRYRSYDYVNPNYIN